VGPEGIGASKGFEPLRPVSLAAAPRLGYSCITLGPGRCTGRLAQLTLVRPSDQGAHADLPGTATRWVTMVFSDACRLGMSELVRPASALSSLKAVN
jgi:hypothetical protein